MQAKVIDIAYFNDLVGCVSRVLERSSFDWLKLRISVVINFDLLCGLRINYRSSRNLRQKDGVLGFVGSWNRCKNTRGGAVFGDAGKVRRQVWGCIRPRSFQIRCLEPAACRQVIIILGRIIDEEIGIGVGRV